MAAFDPMRISVPGRDPSVSPQVFALSMRRASRPTGTCVDEPVARQSLGIRPVPGAKRRAQFAAGRWLLDYAGRSLYGVNAVLAVSENPGRGPVLTVENRAEVPAASLSHSGATVLCGVARNGALGVDVERIRPRSNWEGLTAFALHPRERKRINAMPETLRWAQFFRVWTLKEALGKALGIGLALPFDRIEISGADEIAEAPVDCGLCGTGWHLAALNLGADMAAAIAWRNE